MWDVLWPLLQLLLIVALVLVLAYLFTKYVAGRGLLGGLAAGRDGEDLKVLAQLATGKDQRLLLVKAGGRFFLIGSAPSGITNIAEFTEEEAKVWTEKSGPAEGGQNPSFRESLQTVLRQRRQR